MLLELLEGHSVLLWVGLLVVHLWFVLGKRLSIDMGSLIGCFIIFNFEFKPDINCFCINQNLNNIKIGISLQKQFLAQINKYTTNLNQIPLNFLQTSYNE